MKPLNRKEAQKSRTRPVKVIQFGEGNFLRGFVNWMIDILNEKADYNGDVHIVQPIEKGLSPILNKQDGLYHTMLNGILNGQEIQEKRLITCISGATNPYENYQKYLALADNPELEFIISNTTEAGIAFSPSDTTLDTLPESFPGKLTALLYRRFTTFKGSPTKGLTIIPCELIEKNGDKLKEIILQYVDILNLPDEFRVWITEQNTFCNTLVDRIVPGFPKDDIEKIQEELGYEDKLVVKAEPFHLWVIEGPESLKDKLPVEKAGLNVLFVKDLSPYRTRKVRILNGGHTTLVPVAYLQGLRTVRESVNDRTAGDFLNKAIFEEIIPTLDLPKEELEKYANEVIERFQNPFIHHQLISIALNSISKYKVRVLPSVLGFYKKYNQLPDNLLYSLAALIVFYRGEWNGEKIPLSDDPDIIAYFGQLWQKNDIPSMATGILSNKRLWDVDLTTIEGFSDKVIDDINKILAHEKTLKTF